MAGELRLSDDDDDDDDGCMLAAKSRLQLANGSFCLLFWFFFCVVLLVFCFLVAFCCLVLFLCSRHTHFFFFSLLTSSPVFPKLEKRKREKRKREKKKTWSAVSAVVFGVGGCSWSQKRKKIGVSVVCARLRAVGVGEEKEGETNKHCLSVLLGFGFVGSSRGVCLSAVAFLAPPSVPFFAPLCPFFFFFSLTWTCRVFFFLSFSDWLTD